MKFKTRVYAIEQHNIRDNKRLDYIAKVILDQSSDRTTSSHEDEIEIVDALMNGSLISTVPGTLLLQRGNIDS